MANNRISHELWPSVFTKRRPEQILTTLASKTHHMPTCLSCVSTSARGRGTTSWLNLHNRFNPYPRVLFVFVAAACVLFVAVSYLHLELSLRPPAIHEDCVHPGAQQRAHRAARGGVQDRHRPPAAEAIGVGKFTGRWGDSESMGKKEVCNCVRL